VTSLTANANLVSKIYFPREIFPFSATIVCLVDFVVGAVVLIALMVWYQVPIGPNLAWLPVVVAVQIAFTMALALVLAMANLFYRDVKYIFEVAITLWMFATSVVYPVDRIGGVLGAVLGLNPMTGIVDAYRAVLLLNSPPTIQFWAASAVSVVALTFSWLLFHRLEFRFAESI
jgi:ABC-type polysaccharide/polyol phosphate export permease